MLLLTVVIKIPFVQARQDTSSAKNVLIFGKPLAQKRKETQKGDATDSDGTETHTATWLSS